MQMKCQCLAYVLAMHHCDAIKPHQADSGMRGAHRHTNRVRDSKAPHGVMADARLSDGGNYKPGRAAICL
eukprot:2993893-Pleurochrysis_carterae.AAC.6